MCFDIFGAQYSAVKTLIYPFPVYKNFIIEKKSGGERHISSPNKKLKELQLILLSYLCKHMDNAKDCVHGFTKSKSIVTNAASHCHKKTSHVLNVDLKDFFPSITFFRVRGIFKSHPFNFGHECATVLAQICCFQGSLPQGAPTSPVISNIICRQLDRDLSFIAIKNRASYTRYCDDITFSFINKNYSIINNDICHFDGADVKLSEGLTSIIKKNSFHINQNKTRISSKYHRMEVTGLTINIKPNVRKKYIDQIRGALHSWEKFGYQNASQKWNNIPHKNNVYHLPAPSLHRHLYGKLLHLKSVRGNFDNIYNKLAEKYNRLINQESLLKSTKLPIFKIIQTLDDINSGVFVVECSGQAKSTEFKCSQGTAFSINDEYLITCAHVIAFSEIRAGDADENILYGKLDDFNLKLIEPSSGTEFDFEIIHFDFNKDIALLKFKNTKPTNLKYFRFNSLDPEINEPTHLIGHPNWIRSKKNSIQIDSKITNIHLVSTVRKISLSTTIYSGNSGGPVTNQYLKIVGMAQEGATQDSGDNICLSVDEIKKWLSTLKIKFYA
jgi:RNA-directed DNA polymerase